MPETTEAELVFKKQIKDLQAGDVIVINDLFFQVSYIEPGWRAHTRTNVVLRSIFEDDNNWYSMDFPSATEILIVQEN